MKTSLIKTAIAVALTIIVSSAHAVETRIYSDDLDRKVEIPVQAQRIVALHDVLLTVPLIELGVMPVGSIGRLSKDGKPFIRSGMVLTGYDFENSGIDFIGTFDLDIEKVAALKPDLIIATPRYEKTLAQFEALAPTVVVNYNTRTPLEIFEAVADITNTQDKLAVLERRYQSQLDGIRRIIDTKSIVVNAMMPKKGNINIRYSDFTLGKVLRDAGFRFPKAVDDLKPGGRADFSVERLAELDADYVFATYRTDKKHTPQMIVEEFEAVLPNFCDHLTACKNNNLIVIPRELSLSVSYTALGITAYTVLTHISGNPFAAKLEKK
ncbi:MAG: preprotein translocase YidC [Hyphomicrobiales bacterium]|nr:MAG: preprotein translocase YidC [Hyphomicrobiales bacterium]